MGLQVNNWEDMEVNNYSINWEPKEDITSYELAKAVPILVNGLNGNVDALVNWIENLPDDVSRHFVVEKN